jgi:hypothetical protein
VLIHWRPSTGLATTATSCLVLGMLATGNLERDKPLALKFGRYIIKVKSGRGMATVFHV